MPGIYQGAMAPRDPPAPRIPYSKEAWIRRATAPFGFSTWQNPTRAVVTFEICTQPAEWWRITIEPGATLELPKHLDQAVQTTREIHGRTVIRGGLAPQLELVGGGERVLDAALIPPPVAQVDAHGRARR